MCSICTEINSKRPLFDSQIVLDAVKREIQLSKHPVQVDHPKPEYKRKVSVNHNPLQTQVSALNEDVANGKST